MSTETNAAAPTIDLPALLRQEEERLRAIERTYDRQAARVDLLRELIAALTTPPAPAAEEPTP